MSNGKSLEVYCMLKIEDFIEQNIGFGTFESEISEEAEYLACFTEPKRAEHSINNSVHQLVCTHALDVPTDLRSIAKFLWFSAPSC